MYCYTQSEIGLWVVGFYDPEGEWHTDSDHAGPEAAARRVAWLNGRGGVNDDLLTACERAAEFFDTLVRTAGRGGSFASWLVRGRRVADDCRAAASKAKGG